MSVAGVSQDLSEIQTPGTVLPVAFVPVANANPGDGGTPTREQAVANGATSIPKLEGTWRGLDGSIWFVSSRGDGPNAEDPEDISTAIHAGQIWKYDPGKQSVELVVSFPRAPHSTDLTTSPLGRTGSRWPAPMAKTISGSSGSPRMGARSQSRSIASTRKNSPE